MKRYYIDVYNAESGEYDGLIDWSRPGGQLWWAKDFQTAYRKCQTIGDHAQVVSEEVPVGRK